MGYSPLSAKYRPISDGSKYDYLFPEPELKKTVLKKDGSVDDTVQLMKRIIKEYSYQVRGLAKILKGKTIKESAENVFNFVFKYIKYNVEKGELLRTPAYTWYCAQVCARQGNQFDAKNSADCDCMSIFCGSLFYEMKIPFALRIAAYKDNWGNVGNWQHVYVIVYGDGENITCDPVTHKFNYEKPTGKDKTYPMSLSGNDIIMLSGIDGASRVYEENEDGSVGLLAGRKKRRARRKARRAARREKRKARRAMRKARKAIKKAKKRGDQEALKKAKEEYSAAKARKKEAKKKLAANRSGLVKAVKKVGKGVVKVAKKVGTAIKNFTLKTALLLPRASFLLLMRLNFRGLAKRLSTNQQARDKFAKVWKNLGGSNKKLNKAIEKGKGRKALFGSKKLKGDLEGQLAELGLVLENHGVIDMPTYLGSFGELTIAAVGSAIASAVPIVKKILSVMKSCGVKVPGTAEEAMEDGEDAVEADENEEIRFDNDEVDDGEQPSGDSEESGSNGDESSSDNEESGDGEEDLEGAYFVSDDGELCDMDGLGNITVLGSLFNMFKKNKSARKAKRAAKKSARKQKKTTRKQKRKTKKAIRKAKKTQKKAEKAAKKQTRKDAKRAKKEAKKAQKSASYDEDDELPTPSLAPDAEDTEGGKSKRKGKAKEWIRNNLTVDNAAAAMDVIDMVTKGKRGSSSNGDDTDTTRHYAGGGNPNENSDAEKKEKVKKIVKWGAAGLGVLLVGLGIRAIVKSGNKTKKSQSNLGSLSKIKLK